MKTTSEELTVLVQVVENGSFSRAAEQLAMANSAVSRVVKRLEEKLGVNLINRTTRQLRLTEEGSQYFRRVQKILQEMAAAEAEMLAVHEVPQGVLRVDSSIPMVLHLVFPYFLITSPIKHSLSTLFITAIKPPIFAYVCF